MAETTPNPLPHATPLVFPDGLVGCPDWRRFVLRQADPAAPVALLESEDLPGLSFLVTDPRAWYPDYRWSVSDGDLAALAAAGADSLELLVIATINPEPFTITFNLLGPLVVNRAGGRGRQVIQHQTDYAAAHPVGPDLQSALNGGAPRQGVS